jgi:hypothetical protein
MFAARRIRALPSLALLLAAGLRTIAAQADLPVTKIALFSSGVGYFEHAGTVHGTSTTELRFRTGQINDILKSIMLQDQDGGRVGTVTYPSRDPLTKTLKSFQVDITQNPSLADLLNQLRGARVTILAQGQRLAGTILGVERRQGAAEKPSVAVLNLLTGATIRAVELDAVSSLSLDDAQLQAELTKALAALVQARDQDKKAVTISFTGAGDRRVRVGYVVETPVWKTSYRLVLNPKSQRAYLQGWAIVENQTESDWNNVALSLVSGRPISFTMDLYQPLYATRPTVVPDLFTGLQPQVYDGGTSADRLRTAMEAGGVARRIGYGPDGRPIANQLQEVVVTSAANGPIDLAASVHALGSTAKLGDLFQYTVASVTLARQASAMLPIITDSVAAEPVSIYNANVLKTNPLSGVLLKNTTTMHLLQGPVTVLDKGGYVGDARIDNVPPGQERLVSYGIDLDVTVDNSTATRAASVSTATINRGLLVVSRRLVSSQEYAADNKTDRAKTLVIEHPVRAGWKLVDTRKPFETTPTTYRFKGVAEANKVTTLIVKEETVQSETIGMLVTDAAQLAQYSRAGEIPASVRAALARAVELKQTVLAAQREIDERNQRIAEIAAEQTRIRENMKTTVATTPYSERLLAKLNEQESSIERLQTERESWTAKREAARKQLEEYLDHLTVE